MDKKRYEKGLAVRRAVLGAEHVDKSLRSVDDFTRPMQELVTEYCWVRLGPNRASTTGPAASSTSPCSRP